LLWGFFLKAIAVYKQILQIDPARIDLYARLSELYLKLGLTSDALQSLELLVLWREAALGGDVHHHHGLAGKFAEGRLTAIQRGDFF
jgi:tetratricopeptide (TPR) repeat protein